MEETSSRDRDALIAAIAAIVPRYHDAVQAYDERVGDIVGLAASDGRCLSLLAAGPRSAREIAEGTRLTPAAVTALIDRLEARGLVTRGPDPDDRRKTIVAMSERARALARQYYGPVKRAGAAFLAEFSDEELAVIRCFLDGLLRLQEAELDRLGVP